MVIMALDHVRDYFHVEAMTDDPTNLATTTPFLFFTRWITHFCAPTFVFLSWTGLMILGYCFGSFYKKTVSREQRKKILLTIGAGAIVLFVVLRLINGYGDRAPWSVQKNAELSIISFLNTTKYPPSLMYSMMTLGPAILFLAFFENMKSRFAKFFITFGRVPFFYYLVHLFLIHILTVLAFYISGYGARDIMAQPFFFRPVEFGYSLWAVYGIWAGVILLLYPLCRWYDHYKSTHTHWALSYM